MVIQEYWSEPLWLGAERVLSFCEGDGSMVD